MSKRHNKKLFIVVLLFLFVFVVSVSSVSAVDHSVSGSGFDDIQSSVDGAGNNDRILLGSGTYTSSGNTVLIDNKNLTIQGQSNTNRATLNGRGLSRTIVTHENTTVTLRYIDFVNGSQIDFHTLSIRGAIVIENCSFRNCYGDSGAAVYLFEESSSATIKDCRFINNHAVNVGDNDYTAGGAITSHGSSNVKIINCYFENNTALNHGGAIGLRHGITDAEITNCIFINNSAPNGGAIYIFGSATISGSEFRNNKAKENGGAIIILNNASTSKVINSRFDGNSAKNGGAIYTNSPLNITSTTFSNNKATNNGGGIYSNSNLNITSGTISGNTATYGSGIYNNGVLRLDKVSLLSNKAKILSVSIKSPSYVIKGDKLIVSSSLKSGDNLLNAIYTKNNKVNINGNNRVSDIS